MNQCCPQQQIPSPVIQMCGSVEQLKKTLENVSPSQIYWGDEFGYQFQDKPGKTRLQEQGSYGFVCLCGDGSQVNPVVLQSLGTGVFVNRKITHSSFVFWFQSVFAKNVKDKHKQSESTTTYFVTNPAFEQFFIPLVDFLRTENIVVLFIDSTNQSSPFDRLVYSVSTAIKTQHDIVQKMGAMWWFVLVERNVWRCAQWFTDYFKSEVISVPEPTEAQQAQKPSEETFDFSPSNVLSLQQNDLKKNENDLKDLPDEQSNGTKETEKDTDTDEDDICIDLDADPEELEKQLTKSRLKKTSLPERERNTSPETLTGYLSDKNEEEVQKRPLQNDTITPVTTLDEKDIPQPPKTCDTLTSKIKEEAFETKTSEVKICNKIKRMINQGEAVTELTLKVESAERGEDYVRIKNLLEQDGVVGTHQHFLPANYEQETMEYWNLKNHEFVNILQTKGLTGDECLYNLTSFGDECCEINDTVFYNNKDTRFKVVEKTREYFGVCCVGDKGGFVQMSVSVPKEVGDQIKLGFELVHVMEGEYYFKREVLKKWVNETLIEQIKKNNDEQRSKRGILFLSEAMRWIVDETCFKSKGVEAIYVGERMCKFLPIYKMVERVYSDSVKRNCLTKELFCFSFIDFFSTIDINTIPTFFEKFKGDKTTLERMLVEGEKMLDKNVTLQRVENDCIRNFDVSGLPRVFECALRNIVLGQLGDYDRKVLQWYHFIYNAPVLLKFIGQMFFDK
ncbi:hypothetical protein EIN_118080 [Entamoeba invadens IP1]|uniref:Uncharacterized protein n=1 Tax=Entamoeba invadens IP1 TaxID=370355 RepID=L7FNI2_ENTIV|nr:hypothetical protein EIN_118080 [Entamoeba invadens IP1]ELP92234.1 hypothetical protein EIN_118080 [Entamoeba invadens IP1]|eukprot:XP_004259005.1 hypothetical protein EIN_118080 [Entamoeba invadens IP1]